MRRKTIWMLTRRSIAVRLSGAALSDITKSRSAGTGPSDKRFTHVAFRMSFVSCPVKTTIPYNHDVFRSCAPLSSN